MMKASIVLLMQSFLGHASQAHELFLENSDLNTIGFGNQAVELKSSNNPQKVSVGRCQQLVGLKAFDLAALERYLGRKGGDFSLPLTLGDEVEGLDFAFQYKICRP